MQERFTFGSREPGFKSTHIESIFLVLLTCMVSEEKNDILSKENIYSKGIEVGIRMAYESGYHMVFHLSLGTDLYIITIVIITLQISPRELLETLKG